MSTKRILLVCSGNTCRSPMAAALLQQAWQELGSPWRLQILSAGTNTVPGLKAAEHALQTLSERGLDLSGHRSRMLDKELLAAVDLVLTMTNRHKQYIKQFWPQVGDYVYTAGEFAGQDHDVADPFGGTLAVYRETAVSLFEVMQSVAERIIREGMDDE